MIEWAWILVIPTGWVCWSVGGTGAKWVRRYVYSALLSTALAVLGITWWKWLWVGGWTVLTASLGYGDRATWGKRWLIGCCYALSLWSLSHLATSVILPLSTVWCVGWLWLTRRYNWIPHKLAEGMIGGWHSGMVVWMVSH